jgi:hypothetical protein
MIPATKAIGAHAQDNELLLPTLTAIAQNVSLKQANRDALYFQCVQLHINQSLLSTAVQ